MCHALQGGEKSHTCEEGGAHLKISVSHLNSVLLPFLSAGGLALFEFLGGGVSKKVGVNFFRGGGRV